MKRRLLALSVSIFLLAGTAHGAPPADPPPQPGPAQVAPFDAKAESDVVEAAAKALTENYIFPDKAAVAAALIRDNLQKGRYAGMDKPAFAKQLTDDLQSVTHDKHMRVNVLGAPPPEAAGKGPPPPPPPSLFAFERADRLKGNIGYLKLDGFMGADALSIAADELMPKFMSTDALIIDMRDNHGGDPAGVSRLVSYFVAAGAPVHVNDIIWRKAGTQDYTTQSYFTTPTAVSYRKPVFLVTGSDTFSGGEEFAYDMQVLKLATLYGETTGGGANPGGGHPLGSGLGLFVPSGRAENPITKTNWEGTGVRPDAPTPAADAFSTAYAAALKAVHQPAVTAPAPDAVVAEHLLVFRTKPYAQGEAYIRRQVDSLARGEQPFDIFSPGLAEELKGPPSPEVLADLKALGPVQSVRFVRVDEFGSDEYDVTFAHGERTWVIAINAAGKLVVTFFHPK